MKKITYFALCVMMLFIAACSPEVKTDLWENAVYTEDTAIGTGEKTFSITASAEEKSVVFTISTDCEMLGDALVENGLISGHEGAYGLYVDTVNGIDANYEKDGSYWALTKDGEYMMTGVDSTEVLSGDSFEFTYTKM